MDESTTTLATTYAQSTLKCGDRGFDTSETLNATQGATLVKLGFSFGVRYVGLSVGGGITAAELSALTGAGLKMMLVQFGRSHGLNAAQGTADGTAAARNALAVGYPPGACLWLDLSPAPITDCQDYANAWYFAAVAAGMYGSALGVYCEPGVPFSSSQLYHNLKFARYWKTAGQCPNVDVRGYQMVQLYPGNQVPSPGIIIDQDFVQSDFTGSLPVAAVRAV